MTIYIAGKISGDPNYNEKFARAQDRLEARGHTVINPALRSTDMSNIGYMLLSVADISKTDAVYFLKDWVYSNGANIEHDVCEYCGITMLYEGDDDG